MRLFTKKPKARGRLDVWEQHVALTKQQQKKKPNKIIGFFQTLKALLKGDSIIKVQSRPKVKMTMKVYRANEDKWYDQPPFQ